MQQHRIGENACVCSKAKDNVGPIKENQGNRIIQEIKDFTLSVKAYRVEFFKREFFRYEMGFEAAWLQIDQAACEILALETKCSEFVGLANMFDFPDLVEDVSNNISTTKQELIMVKDVWDTSSLCELQFQVRLRTRARFSTLDGAPC